jgi:hypothetical protein
VITRNLVITAEHIGTQYPAGRDPVSHIWKLGGKNGTSPGKEKIASYFQAPHDELLLSEVKA